MGMGEIRRKYDRGRRGGRTGAESKIDPHPCIPFIPSSQSPPPFQLLFFSADRSGKSTRTGERTNPETKEEDLTKMQVEKAERWRNDTGPRVLKMYINAS